jgi:transcription elongation factor Elf1
MGAPGSQLFSDNLSYPDSLWNFENGAFISNDAIWYFTPPLPPYGSGIYNLELRMETDFPCRDRTNKSVEIMVMPKINPDTSWTNKQCGTDVEFTFNANPTEVNDYSYYIDDRHNPNSPITTTHIFTYPFNYPGIYLFTQYISNLNGCYDSIIDYLHVYPNPIADFSADINEGCEALAVNFINNSFIEWDSLYNNGSSTIITWDWEFGDGEIFPDSSSSHTYNTDSTGSIISYFPALYIETNFGCYGYFELIDGITIHPTPIPFISTPAIQLGPGLYNFDGSDSKTSNGADADATNFDFVWIINGEVLADENEENINYQFSPNLNYQSVNDPIEYEVCLLLRDKFTFSDTTQCDSIYCIQLFVDYFKGLYVPNALAPNGGMPETDEFLPKGKSLKEYNLQIFDTWGNLVWQTSALTTLDGKPTTAWKGTTLDNKPLQQGTYVWKIYAKFSDGSVWPGIDGKTTGPIYLIR